MFRRASSYSFAFFIKQIVCDHQVKTLSVPVVICAKYVRDHANATILLKPPRAVRVGSEEVVCLMTWEQLSLSYI